jgi:hypothetical protein
MSEVAELEGTGRAPISEGEARRREIEVIQRQSHQSGRLEVALQVKALLRGQVATQKMPDARPLTSEERAVWDLVEGFAQRLGATIEEVKAGHR